MSISFYISGAKMVTNLGVNNKQWMCKEQARSDIVNEQKAQEKVSFALFLNSDWPIVQV